MSQIFEALQRSQIQQPTTGSPMSDLDASAELLGNPDTINLDKVPSLRVTSDPERPRLLFSEDHILGAEKIRILGTKLRHMQNRRPLKSILITSTVKDEGKSMLSANLAFSLATTKQRVLLLDGDLHQPTVHRLLGANGLLGISGWWHSKDPIMNYMRKIEGLSLWFLSAGEPVPGSLELLQSSRFSELLAQMSQWFDWIIIDSPPLAPLADSMVWANLADATLLVARLGKTPKKLLNKVLESMDKQKLLGLVLNECSDPHTGYYSQYYRQVLTGGKAPRNGDSST